MLRLGILSFAHLHAEAYLQNVRAIPDVELIGIADENAERGAGCSPPRSRTPPNRLSILREHSGH